MRKTRLFLTVAFAAMLLSACGNKKQADELTTEQVEEFYSGVDETSARQRDNKSVKMEIPGKMKNTPEQILHRTGYTVSYNSTTKTPNWVAWHLTKDHISGSSHRSQEMFQEDHQVKNGPTNSDYFNSGFDRGHMCPAGVGPVTKLMTMGFLLLPMPVSLIQLKVYGSPW